MPQVPAFNRLLAEEPGRQTKRRSSLAQARRDSCRVQ